MVNKQLVYLVGPITGCSYKGCTEWREEVKKELEATGFYHCFSPMRGKDHLDGQEDLPATIPSHIKRPTCSDHDIFARDYYDCNRASILFCNLIGATQISIGSMFELAWGSANRGRTYVVVCMEPGNPHDHAFVRESAAVIFPTLEAGVEYIKKVLNR